MKDDFFFFLAGTALAPLLSTLQLPLDTQLSWNICWVSEVWGGWRLPWIVRASLPSLSASSSRWTTGKGQQRYSSKHTRWGKFKLTNYIMVLEQNFNTKTDTCDFRVKMVFLWAPPPSPLELVPLTIFWQLLMKWVVERTWGWGEARQISPPHQHQRSNTPTKRKRKR